LQEQALQVEAARRAADAEAQKIAEQNAAAIAEIPQAAAPDGSLTGRQILATVESEKDRQTVEKYGFDLRGLKVCASCCC
jgi:chaperonin GroEL (HSP60 family)